MKLIHPEEVHQVAANISYSKLRAIAHIARGTRGGCHWITFDSILDCLKSNHLEDINVPHVFGTSHDAARIATMVRKLQAGQKLDPVEIYVRPRKPQKRDRREWCCWFHDGNHRLRAHQFMNMVDSIPAIITGHINFLKSHGVIQ